MFRQTEILALSLTVLVLRGVGILKEGVGKALRQIAEDLEIRMLVRPHLRAGLAFRNNLFRFKVGFWGPLATSPKIIWVCGPLVSLVFLCPGLTSMLP